MPNAADTTGTVFVKGTCALLARVVGFDGEPLKQADVSTITYTIYELDDADPTARTAVDGHTAVPLTIAEVIFDSLQTDAAWTVDATGYNFRHLIDIGVKAAFTVAQQRYLVEYTIEPASGQPILVRFLLSTI
jgi:hypothetical protein